MTWPPSFFNMRLVAARSHHVRALCVASAQAISITHHLTAHFQRVVTPDELTDALARSRIDTVWSNEGTDVVDLLPA